MADVCRLPTRGAEQPGNLLAQVLSGDLQVPPPDELQPWLLASREEQRRRIRFVLVRGWALYRRGQLDLTDSVRVAAGDSFNVAMHAHNVMRSILSLLDLAAWESHKSRTRADVHLLFRRAISRCTPHRGGWRSTKPIHETAR